MPKYVLEAPPQFGNGEFTEQTYSEVVRVVDRKAICHSATTAYYLTGLNYKILWDECGAGAKREWEHHYGHLDVVH